MPIFAPGERCSWPGCGSWAGPTARIFQIDYRYGAGEAANIAPVAKELVDLHPDALFAITALSAVALRQYTFTIPTVFVQVGDPVALGLVTNLARPDGNITGFTSFNYDIGGKWVETLKDTVPGLTWGQFFLSREIHHRRNIYLQSKRRQQSSTCA